MTIDMPRVDALGAEFFRWEIATATAGRILEINPFDEPNVQQAKDATHALLDAYTTRGAAARACCQTSRRRRGDHFSAAARSADANGLRSVHRSAEAARLFRAARLLPPDDDALAPVAAESGTASR
jgi:hypothetical protein